MKIVRLLGLIFVLLLVAASCKKKTKVKKDSYFKGELVILTDESFRSVTEALADGYMINYPEASLKVKAEKEDFALMGLLQNKAKAVVMSRELTAAEKEEFKRVTDMDPVPAQFAADAVLFVVPKNSPKTQITMDEIRSELASESKNIVFDATNSSNLNFVAQKLGKKAADLKFSIINGNRNVIEQISRYPDKVGVVALNTFSRPYDEESELLRQQVKILPVVDSNVAYLPNNDNLRNMNYPFTRILYFLTNEKTFDMANGLMRYSCSYIGQKIVQKEGLQPYYLFQREVQMR